MKCYLCKKGLMKIVKDIMEEDNIEFEAFKCNNCGEEIMNMSQLKILAEKYKKLRKAKEGTFAKWGNSMAIRIPNEIIHEYKIKAGNQCLITKDKIGIRIIPS